MWQGSPIKYFQEPGEGEKSNEEGSIEAKGFEAKASLYAVSRRTF
jgi:hypothetical protein